VSEIVSLGLRALAGGAFVMAFAALGEVLVPKPFAGIVSAAPSVAFANLLIIALSKGSPYGQREAQGMIVGALAFVVAALAGRSLVGRRGGLRGSLGLCAVWLVVALGGYAAVLR